MLHAQTDLYLALEFAQLCFSKGDHTTALRKLQSIEQQCKASKVWQDNYTFHSLRAKIRMESDPSSPQAIEDLRCAWEAYPKDELPTPTYLEAGFMLSEAYFHTENYDLCEQTASETLVRAINLRDSCAFTSVLLGYLAECYEQRGDTILSDAFHYEAIFSALRFHNLVACPDSAEFRNRELAYKHASLSQISHNSDKHPRDYINTYSTLASDCAKSGNVNETIWLCEKVLNFYRDNHFPYDYDCHQIFYELLCEYAYTCNFAKLEAWLPEATALYELYPHTEIDAAALYYTIGKEIASRGRLREAHHYLIQAKSRVSDTTKIPIREGINRLLMRCR